jgi:hypothetical protein
MYPIVGIAGNAGVGKDTFANFLIEGRNGAIVSQADHIKRFVHHVFGCSEETLWGASELRNAPIPALLTKEGWYKAWIKYFEPPSFAIQWANKIQPGAIDKLDRWFYWTENDVRAGTIPNTARALLQSLGTEFGRQLGQNIWSGMAIKTAQKLLCGGYAYNRLTGVFEFKNSACDLVVIPDLRFRNEVLSILQIGGTTIRITLNQPDKALVGGIAGHPSEAELGGIPKHWFTSTFVNDKTWGLDYLKNKAIQLLEK